MSVCTACNGRQFTCNVCKGPLSYNYREWGSCEDRDFSWYSDEEDFYYCEQCSNLRTKSFAPNKDEVTSNESIISQCVYYQHKDLKNGEVVRKFDNRIPCTACVDPE